MKLLAGFILLSMVNISVLGAGENQQPDINDDDKRLWSFVNSEDKTYVALHLLRGIVKLIFSDDQHKFPEIMFHVPPPSSACEAITLKAKFLVNNNGEYLECRFKEDRGLAAYIYENCTGIPDNGIHTAVKWDRLEIEASRCFRNGYTFSSFESGKSFMTLALEGNLKCSAFFVLPATMKIEHVPLKQADRLRLNQTEFPGDASNWWKKVNHPKLPKQIHFVDGNPMINVLNSTNETLFSFRIGINQVIPSFKLDFGGSACNNGKMTLYLNEFLSDECGVTISPKLDGYEITTKGIAHGIPVRSRTLFLMFVNAKVYVKVVENGVPQSMQEFGICDVSNFEPTDQFSLRTSFDGDDCTSASITLDSNDVQNGIEVLVDPAIAASGDDISPRNDTGDHNPASGEETLTANENGDAASAAMEPWIFIVIGIVVLALIAVAAGILLYCFCIKKKRQARPPSPKESKIMTIEDDKKSEDLKTGIPKSLQIEPTQEDSAELPPGNKADNVASIIEQLPEDLLKNAGIHGFEMFFGFCPPWDYHAKEAPFKATIDFADKKVCSVPAAVHYRNFWFCLGRLYHLKRNKTPIFADKKRGHEAVNIIQRDLVLDTGSYAPFRQLANRILERCANDVPLNQLKDPYAKKLKPAYTLRVFLIYYEPITIEVHCRGRCPLFLFEIFKECEKCKKILNELKENNWLKTSATCHEDWDTFLCRVKRTPCEFHQFLSFNDKDEPTNPELINHIFIIRGAYGVKEIRTCLRKCNFSSMAHHNTYDIDRDVCKY